MGLSEAWLECDLNDVTQIENKYVKQGLNQIKNTESNQIGNRSLNKIENSNKNQVGNNKFNQERNGGKRETAYADDDAHIRYLMRQRAGSWHIGRVITTIVISKEVTGR